MGDLDQVRFAVARAWEALQEGRSCSNSDIAAVQSALVEIDAGRWRAASQRNEDVVVDEVVKQAVLLSLALNEKHHVDGWPGSYDRLPLKMHGWSAAEFEEAAIRSAPGAIVRYPAHIGRNTVLMPSFVNAGAYVGDSCMVDTWSTIGSCAQIGNGCHISGGAGIGGVLEPIQASPVILEDNVFVGARSEIAEGTVVRTGAVLAPGCFVTQSTKIVDRTSGRVSYGEIPAHAVVVPGSMSDPDTDVGLGLQCMVIVKTVDATTRQKVGINELLRL